MPKKVQKVDSTDRKRRNQTERDRVNRLDDEFQHSLALLKPVKRSQNVSRAEILEKLIDQYVEDFPDVKKNTEVDNGFRMRRTLPTDEKLVVVKGELETMEDEKPCTSGHFENPRNPEPNMSSPTKTRNIQKPQEVEEIKREEIIPKVEDPVHIELFPVLSESIDYILGLPAFPDTLQVNFNKL